MSVWLVSKYMWFKAFRAAVFITEKKKGRLVARTWHGVRKSVFKLYFITYDFIILNSSASQFPQMQIMSKIPSSLYFMIVVTQITWSSAGNKTVPEWKLFETVT